MITLQHSRRARSIAPPLFALVALVTFAAVVMATTGCSATPELLDAAGTAIEAAAPALTAATGTAVGATGVGVGTVGLIASIVSIAAAKAGTYLHGKARDKRKERGEDPLQLSGVVTPPLSNPEA